MAAATNRRSVAIAIAVATASALPVFLTGALAVQVRDDLDFGEAALGVAAASFFVTGAVTSTLSGRLAEIIGAERAMRLAVAVSAASMAGIASGAHSWGALVGWLMVGGLGNSIAQPATNLFLARSVAPARQGLAFGVKQSAVPISTLLGGLAVPALALTVGWRWAYAVGAVGAAAVVACVPRLRRRVPKGRGRRGESDAPLAALVVLAVGTALGAGAAQPLGAFLVSSAVAEGFGEAQAGILLTGGSVVGLSVRMLSGARADRRGRAHLPVVAAMLAAGALGYVLLATGVTPLFVLGVPIAFGAGWGWPGLFILSIVRNNPSAPGAATGITQTGTYVGAVGGPLAFGAAVEASSYRVAWSATAIVALLGAGAMLWGRRLLVQAHARRAAGAPRLGP